MANGGKNGSSLYKLGSKEVVSEVKLATNGDATGMKTALTGATINDRNQIGSKSLEPSVTDKRWKWFGRRSKTEHYGPILTKEPVVAEGELSKKRLSLFQLLWGSPSREDEDHNPFFFNGEECAREIEEQAREIERRELSSL